jgi:hypothetical protein
LGLLLLRRVTFLQDFVEDAARTFGIAHVDIGTREVERCRLRSSTTPLLAERSRWSSGKPAGCRFADGHLTATPTVDTIGGRRAIRMQASAPCRHA